jgi:hypothetical protein
MELKIAKLGLLSAHFASVVALTEFGDEAAAYNLAVLDYDRTGDDIAFATSLSELGHDPAEIRWHVNRPGQRMARGYL